ncbi:MAG: hypothetical protein ACJAR0_003958 [Candidatus Azotimanducaceae bacterium]|jgi:uncharacterized protein (TIGR02001 family)
MMVSDKHRLHVTCATRKIYQKFITIRWAPFLIIYLFLHFSVQNSYASEKERSPRIGTVGATLSMATDYVFRGISQTLEEPQVQVDINWSHKSGWYAGAWSSNTEFGGDGNSMEFDPYIGFSSAVADTNWRYDLGYWHYHFPGAQADFDYGEFYGTVSYGPENVNASFSVFYADDFFGSDFFGDGSSVAFHGKFIYSLDNDVSLSARVGRQTFDEPVALVDQNYTYYDIGVSKRWIGFTLDLRWHDTVGVKSDYVAGSLADGRLVARVSRGF